MHHACVYPCQKSKMTVHRCEVFGEQFPATSSREPSWSRYKIRCADRPWPALAMLTSDGIYKVATEFKDSYALSTKSMIGSWRIFSLFNSCFPYLIISLPSNQASWIRSSWEAFLVSVACMWAPGHGGDDTCCRSTALLHLTSGLIKAAPHQEHTRQCCCQQTWNQVATAALSHRVQDDSATPSPKWIWHLHHAASKMTR
jgi:hypothetical protein